MLPPLVLGLALAALARVATAAAAASIFGLNAFVVCFALEGVALALLAPAVLRLPAPRALKVASGAFLVVALAHLVTVVLGLRFGAGWFLVGDLLLVAGFAGAAGQAFFAAAAPDRAGALSGLRAHLVVAAAAPAVFVLLNVTGGFWAFALTSALLLAGLVLVVRGLAAWAPEGASDKAKDPTPMAGA